MKTTTCYVDYKPRHEKVYAVISFRKDNDLVWWEEENQKACEEWIDYQRNDKNSYFTKKGKDAEIAIINYVFRP